MPDAEPTRWQASEPYRPRTIRSLPSRQVNTWRLKLYAIQYGAAPWAESEFAGLFPLIESVLPEPARTPERPGVGFVILHQGRGVSYGVLSWWDRENELCQRIWVRPVGPEAGWRQATDREGVCVWDLQVIWFERQAYVETVLAPADGADVPAYLARHLDIP